MLFVLLTFLQMSPFPPFLPLNPDSTVSSLQNLPHCCLCPWAKIIFLTLASDIVFPCSQTYSLPEIYKISLCRVLDLCATKLLSTSLPHSHPTALKSRDWILVMFEPTHQPHTHYTPSLTICLTSWPCRAVT